MREPAEKPDTELPVTSSVPEELPPEQEALFREVLILFEKEQLPYAVSGGFAMQQHTGICRFTKDLDTFLSPADASKALFLLGERGFAWRFAIRSGWPKRTAMVILSTSDSFERAWLQPCRQNPLHKRFLPLRAACNRVQYCR
jgi:hypothetical protein